MDFKTATDRLTDCVTHGELARETGVSLASIRQARLSPDAAANRAPPTNWREVVVRLARRRAQDLNRLADELEQSET